MNEIFYSINGKNYSKEALLAWCNKQIVGEELAWEGDIAQFILAWFTNSDTISIQTSGTTGSAKHIELNKNSMLASAILTNGFFDIDETKNALLCIPAKYIGGKMMILRWLLSGCNLVITKPSASPLDNIDVKIDFCPMVPLQVEHSLEKQFAKFKDIKNIIIGGAPISHQLETHLSSLKQNIYATFGMTETASHIALKKLTGGNKSNSFEAMPGVTFELSKKQESLRCLVINAKHINTKPFITKDIVELVDENTFVWKGRYDNIINSGGVKINPEEIEKEISKHLEGNFFLGGIPDDKLGEKLILVIESDQKVSDEQSLLDTLKEQLPLYNSPREIHYLQSFSRTVTGKIMRKACLEKINSK
jgi:O-succinylbenzoic acid--CoA ligase